MSSASAAAGRRGTSAGVNYRPSPTKGTSEKEQRLARLHDVLEENKERLNRIFAYYCSFGEPLNIQKLKSSKFIKLLKESKLLELAPTRVENKNASLRMASAGASPKSRANKVLPSNDLPCISKVQADLLFKKHTGLTKNKLPPSNAVASSFARDK